MANQTPKYCTSVTSAEQQDTGEIIVVPDNMNHEEERLRDGDEDHTWVEALTNQRDGERHMVSRLR